MKANSLNHLPRAPREASPGYQADSQAVRWIICPFVGLESALQLHQHRERTAQLQRDRTRAAAPSTPSVDRSTGMGATAAPASPSTCSDSKHQFDPVS
jgi:hypothetical protein